MDKSNRPVMKVTHFGSSGRKNTLQKEGIRSYGKRSDEGSRKFKHNFGG